MRYYIKRGWIVIELQGSPFYTNKYQSARAWCASMFESNTWVARLSGGTVDSKFAFKHERDATLFSMKWSYHEMVD